LVLSRPGSRQHERGTKMTTLVIGLAVLVVTVVLASYTHEGSWLVYFESLAESEHLVGEAEEEKSRVHTLSNVPTTKGQDRITALPNRHHSKNSVYK
jgi:hypothetical protein